MNLANRLIKAKALTAIQLAPALHRQKQNRGFLAGHLTELGIMKPGELEPFLQSCPLVPQSFDELGLPEKMLAQLFLKHAFYSYHFTVREMAEALKLPMQLLESLLDYLKQQKFVDISPRDALSPAASQLDLARDFRYTLSDMGKVMAEQYLEFNSYVGPAPVSMEDYWDWVEAQTIMQVQVKESRLREVFKDYVVSERFFDDMGPAVSSGRSIFLYGPSGNGKTLAARTAAEIFDDPVYVPYALYVHGQIIRVFNEAHFEPVVAAPGDRPQCDPRWVLCRRPVIVAGGEMTEAALEPKYDPGAKFYEAPHQMQANNGVFIVDDFGRQQISPKALLNRWMFPLETRQDFCNLQTGQQFAIPFDQLIVFATNLDPGSLADEAFFRRIRHKVFMGDVTKDQYLEIFRRVCSQYGIAFDEKVVKQIMKRYYTDDGQPMRACHPRDLVEKVLDRAKFWRRAPELTYKELELACRTYFVKNIGYVDYDVVEQEPETEDT